MFLRGRVRGVGGLGGALTCSLLCCPATSLFPSDERAAVGDLGFLPAAGQEVKPKPCTPAKHGSTLSGSAVLTRRCINSTIVWVIHDDLMTQVEGSAAVVAEFPRWFTGQALFHTFPWLADLLGCKAAQNFGLEPYNLNPDMCQVSSLK